MPCKDGEGRDAEDDNGRVSRFGDGGVKGDIIHTDSAEEFVSNGGISKSRGENSKALNISECTFPGISTQFTHKVADPLHGGFRNVDGD